MWDLRTIKFQNTPAEVRRAQKLARVLNGAAISAPTKAPPAPVHRDLLSLPLAGGASLLLDFSQDSLTH